MCKHHWLLGTTTLSGTPAHCKLCGQEKVFCTAGLSWETATEVRKRPHGPQPSRVSCTELPFNPHGYVGKMVGNRL